mmetsp:Transcript_7001/g.11468  ORF Transcript_7001/g.11468 Transcript_7001/m.11468 type:complete len:80 (+) Transcript_7001:765-1004(+)
MPRRRWNVTLPPRTRRHHEAWLQPPSATHLLGDRLDRVLEDFQLRVMKATVLCIVQSKSSIPSLRDAARYLLRIRIPTV